MSPPLKDHKPLGSLCTVAVTAEKEKTILPNQMRLDSKVKLCLFEYRYSTDNAESGKKSNAQIPLDTDFCPITGVHRGRD